MQFSENWLRTFVNTKLDTQTLSHALTMAGLEVEACEPAGVVFSKVVVAKILSAEKHPDADRLRVCIVDVGQSAPLQIVCGATNARAGLCAPCALVGAELPGISIKQAKVRGVESFGMMCSAKELGFTNEAAGLLELSDNAVIGQDIRTLFDLDDNLITLKLTPNRADCLSIAGVARDVAAITGEELTLPNVQAVKAQSTVQKMVEIVAKEACARYCGRVISGVNALVKTPDWLLRRLERSGIRSISAIVDITNYVLLELGQPMHAFDAAKLQGDITVRFAVPGEKIILLNDQTVALKSDDLVVADHSGAIALAGIMGGESTSVSDITKDIFLESAFFIPDAIVGKARRLGLSTDSSYRFERGVDYGNTMQALERATALVLEICGGSAGMATEVITQLPVRKQVKLRLNKLNSILGITFQPTTIAKFLKQLNFEFHQQDDVFTVIAPSYRFDIQIEEDLIEEIARLHGYEHIPALAPVAHLEMLATTETQLSVDFVRDTLVAAGYQEAVTYSFVDESWERDLHGNANPIYLKNPIASNMNVMRSSLWAGLLDALAYNLNRKQSRAMLFELGANYHAGNDDFIEQQQVSGVFYGSNLPEQWGVESRDVDFYDVKSIVDTLTQGRATYQPPTEKNTHPALHPGQSAQVMLDGKEIGWLGKLHPKWQQQYNFTKATVMFELALTPLLQCRVAKYQEVLKYLPNRRDMAIIVEDSLPVQTIIDSVNIANIPHIMEVALFDIYKGKGIDSGKKSLAFLVLMQDTDKTLVDADADLAMAKLFDLMSSKFGAILRN